MSESNESHREYPKDPGEAGGTHLARLPPQDVGARRFEPTMELVEPHIVVALWPALLAEIDSEHEDRVDELGVAEVVSAEIVLRPDRVDSRRAGTRRPATERDAHDLAGEAAVDELSPRRGPAVEPRIVERTLLEARALGHDLTEVGSVELA